MSPLSRMGVLLAALGASFWVAGCCCGTSSRFRAPRRARVGPPPASCITDVIVSDSETGPPVSSFSSSSRPIVCRAMVAPDDAAGGTVRVVATHVSTGKVLNSTQRRFFGATPFSSSPSPDQAVRIHLEQQGPMPLGEYRCEVILDSKSVKSVGFFVR